DRARRFEPRGPRRNRRLDRVRDWHRREDRTCIHDDRNLCCGLVRLLTETYMANTARTGLTVIAAVLVALLAGFLWGASGKSTLDRALQRSELRNELLEARAATLAARVDVYNTNFGDASGHLEDARSVAGRAAQRLEALGR